MVTIGTGNGKGGVGSTTITLQFGALLQRAGLTVTVVETSSTCADLHWCTSRAARKRQVMNVTKQAVSYLHRDDCPCRLKDYELGTDFALLDHSNERQDIEVSLGHVQHWVCPFGPLDVRATLLTYERWQAVHPDALARRQTFSAVLSLAPGVANIASEPRYAEPRWNGDKAVETLACMAPGMHILRQRLTRSEAMADMSGGMDVFSSPALEARSARLEIESAWGELLAHWKRGGVPPMQFTDLGRFPKPSSGHWGAATS